MTTPVNKALALLLKEKGFDEKCINFSIVGDGKYTYTLYVPTIAEAVMWFYKKHGIWIQVSVSRYGNFYSNILKKEATKSLNKPINWEVQSQLNDFNSPTEAYEAAIEYVLTNLI